MRNHITLSPKIILTLFPAHRTILNDVPMTEGMTTIHFPDIDATYFRSLLDFLYSGQTCVPATDVEHLHDLLDLLQIKPGVWRTGDKNGKETVEVLTRIFAENDEKLESSHAMNDLNSNQSNDETTQARRRSKSRESSPSQLSVKMERLNDSSCEDEDHEEINVEEELTTQRRSRRKKGNHASGDLYIRDDGESDSRIEDDRANDGNSSEDKGQNASTRRRSSSDPVNLSLGYRERDEDSNDGHIDIETIGNAPSKVSAFISFAQTSISFFNNKY